MKWLGGKELEKLVDEVVEFLEPDAKVRIEKCEELGDKMGIIYLIVGKVMQEAELMRMNIYDIEATRYLMKKFNVTVD